MHRHRGLPPTGIPNSTCTRTTSPGSTKGSAREWLHEEFDEPGMHPTNPVGKVLVLDVILNVAKYGGEQRFAQGGDRPVGAARSPAAWRWPWTARWPDPASTLGFVVG